MYAYNMWSFFERSNDGPFCEDEEFLFCPQSKLRYRVDQGIPVMLVDDAERLDEEACTLLTDKARELGLV